MHRSQAELGPNEKSRDEKNLSKSMKVVINAVFFPSIPFQEVDSISGTIFNNSTACHVFSDSARTLKIIGGFEDSKPGDFFFKKAK